MLLNSAPSLGYGHLPAFTLTWTAGWRPEFLLFLPRFLLLLLVPRDAPGAGMAGGSRAMVRDQAQLNDRWVSAGTELQVTPGFKHRETLVPLD